MNLLIVGNSTAGSWQMRGVQLGAAVGARVTCNPTERDFACADVIVLVKRAILEFGEAARRTGKPIVWDALDFWTQPASNGITPNEARYLAGARSACSRLHLIIGATEAMAKALGGVYLPHHSWSGLQPTPARKDVQSVAYEGNVLYLGRWAGWLQSACEARGWTFVINPPDLSQADILVAFRDGPWDGWICREWKSGVKVVNASAAGRPLIAQDSAAWRELQPEGSVVESPDALGAALDKWAPISVRASVVERSAERAPAFTLEAVAKQYLSILETRGLACA